MKKQEKEELKVIFNELRKGNKEVIENFYKKYDKLIYGAAFSILKDKDDSEDIVQTVFSKLYAIDQDKFPSDKEATWLYTVTKNEALLLLRKKGDSYDLEKVYNIEKQNNEINELIDRENYNQLINKLDNKEKEVVSLKVISNFSFKQISELLGEPIGTVKWRYYKSIYALRIMLSNLGMFIVTFIITITSFRQTNKKSNSIMQQEDKNEKEENINDSFKEENIENALKDEDVMSKVEKEENDEIKNDEEIKENTITQDTIIESNVNYFGYGIMSVSAVFLILTIIFAIILKKHQLNLRKKSSK